MSKCKHCAKHIKKNGAYQIIPLGKVHKDCMQDFINKAIIKAKLKNQEKREKQKEEMKVYKKEVKRETSIKSTQTAFNRYIRWRDTRPEGKGSCISCRNMIEFGSQSTHAGHYYTRGARSDLRFNPDNVHAQCEQCNMHNNCRIPGSVMENYKKNLLKKIGKSKYDLLTKRIQQDYSQGELDKIRKKFNKLIK